MLDFVFLMLAFFACLTITQATIKDRGINLVKVGPAEAQATSDASHIERIISICVTADGNYKWLTEYNEFLLADAAQIGDELSRQLALGTLPKETTRTQVLLQIDQKAQWSAVSSAIFAIRERGFEVHPVYQPDFSAGLAASE
jgi:biopolymer transport protein ExbD